MDEKQKIKAAYESGKSIKEAARDAGVSYTRARKSLIVSGAKLRGRGRPRKAKK